MMSVMRGWYKNTWYCHMMPVIALVAGVCIATDVLAHTREWLADNWLHLAMIAIPNMIIIIAFLVWNHRKSAAQVTAPAPTAIRASDSRDVANATHAAGNLCDAPAASGAVSASSNGDRGPGAMDPKFSALLAPYDLKNMHSSPHTIYGVWANDNLTMGYANSGWFDHAKFNGGTAPYFYKPMGISLLASMPELLRPFFAENFRRVIREQRPWEHIYECSSPERYRLLHMIVFPLHRDGSSSPRTIPLSPHDGLLVIHSLRVERPHDRLPLPPLDHLYRDTNGFLQQCVHCRRVLRQLSVSSPTNNNKNTNNSGPGASESKRTSSNRGFSSAGSSSFAPGVGVNNGSNGTWDWVPAWLHRPQARTTHGTCPPCSHFYFSDHRLEMAADQQFPSSWVTGEVVQYPPASLPSSPDVERWATQWRAATIPNR